MGEDRSMQEIDPRPMRTGRGVSNPGTLRVSVVDSINSELENINVLHESIKGLESKLMLILGPSVADRGDKLSDETPPETINQRIRFNTHLIKLAIGRVEELANRVEL